MAVNIKVQELIPKINGKGLEEITKILSENLYSIQENDILPLTDFYRDECKNSLNKYDHSKIGAVILYDMLHFLEKKKLSTETLKSIKDYFPEQLEHLKQLHEFENGSNVENWHKQFEKTDKPLNKKLETLKNLYDKDKLTEYLSEYFLNHFFMAINEGSKGNKKEFRIRAINHYYNNALTLISKPLENALGIKYELTDAQEKVLTERYGTW